MGGGEYTQNMDYRVGSRVRVKLHSGKEVEAKITAITNQPARFRLSTVA